MTLVPTFLNESNPLKVLTANRIYLTLDDNIKYMDVTAGFTSHAILGWTQPKVNEAILAQLEKICHLDYKTFTDPNRDLLADLLIANSEHSLDKVFFVGSSGAEACEAALKLSFQSHYNNGKKNKAWFISRNQSYHGATNDALSLGERPNLSFFKPMFPEKRAKISEHNVYRYKKKNETIEEYSERSAKELENKIIELGPENVSGFVAETMLGGLVGDVPPTPKYWEHIRNICDKYDVHLIIDEVWCGTGTSGKMYCIDWDKVTPDIIFLGKTLGAGFLPISALITSEKIIDPIKKGHGFIGYSSTFQGHSTCIAAAYEVQKIINNKSLLESVIKKGNFIRNTIDNELKRHEFFCNVRGRGLRNSVEYNCDDVHLFSLLLSQIMKDDHHILISSKWHRTSFTPALIIDEDEINKMLDSFFKTFYKISSDWTIEKRKNVKIKPMF